VADPIVTIAVVTAALLAANALFVAAEFAVVSAPRPAVEHRASRGDRLARRVLRTMTSTVAQDRYIATAQIGITFASLGLGMYGEHTLALWLEPRLAHLGWVSVAASHTLASVVAVSLLSYLHIFLGEMIPKSLALAHALGTARLVHWPMQVSGLVFAPFVLVLNGIGNACLRLLGVQRPPERREQAYTPEELQLIVEESERGGVFRGEAGRILHELFEFGDRTAREAMVPRVRVVGLPSGASAEEIRRTVARQRVTRYPVYESDLDHIVGVVHARDLLARLRRDEPLGADEVRRIPVVPATAPLDDVLATLQRQNAHLAAVIDEHGGTAGIISLEDLFEEVVGEIDEGGVVALERQPDGSVRAAGTVRLDELGDFFHLDLEHEEVDSVSGLVLSRLGRPPVVGDVVEFDRLRVEVTAVSGRGVKEARVVWNEEPAERQGQESPGHD
jgi:CBS domain containing-hemolysin-like protein